MRATAHLLGLGAGEADATGSAMRGADRRAMRRRTASRHWGAAAIASVVAPARVPGLRLRERQLQAAGAARLLRLAPVVLAATEVVPVVIVVVAQPEEPHE